MNMEAVIRNKLADLSPQVLEIIDDTDDHAGHFSVIPGVSTHFSIKIVTDQFKGVSMLARHKMVYALLGEELKRSIHALSLKTLTMVEYQENK